MDRARIIACPVTFKRYLCQYRRSYLIINNAAAYSFSYYVLDILARHRTGFRKLSDEVRLEVGLVLYAVDSQVVPGHAGSIAGELWNIRMQAP